MHWRFYFRFRWRKNLKILVLLSLISCLICTVWPPKSFRGISSLPRPHKRRIQEAALRGASGPKGILPGKSLHSHVLGNATPASVWPSKGQSDANQATFASNYSQLIQMRRRRISLMGDRKNKRDEVYFAKLVREHKVQRLPSGGERIISSPSYLVQFPHSLKNISPEKWTGFYRTYLNITFYPWPKSELCRQFSTTFAPPGSLKLMALASFPSSGNSWVRYLIENGCGIFTGSMYNDFALKRRGLYGEGVTYDSGMTIVQKTHGYTTGNYMKLPHEERIKGNHMETLNNQGMIIIRNPFKALISHRHLDIGGHTGYAPQSHFVGEGWKEFILIKIKLWKEFYIDWLEACRAEDLHVVFYEDIASDPITMLYGILKFSHLPIDNRRILCLSNDSEGMFKRKATKYPRLYGNPYTMELKMIIYQAIEDLNAALLQRGKKSLPTNKYEMYNATEASIAREWKSKTKTLLL